MSWDEPLPNVTAFQLSEPVSATVTTRLPLLERAMTAVGIVALCMVAGCSTGNDVPGGPGTPAPMANPPVGEPARPVVLPDVPAPVPLELENLDCAAQAPVPSEGRLLTRLQYQNTVADLFSELALDPATISTWVKDFPAENEVLGYRTNAEFHRATPWLVEAHVAAAESVAGAVRQNLATLLPCSAGATDPPRANEGMAAGDAGVEAGPQQCGEVFLDRFAERAFRRPLQPSERTVFTDLLATTLAISDLPSAIEVVVQALLQSPQFLYRFDTNQTSPLAADTAYALDGYELASRLSYLLWNSMPDEELWQSATAGKLTDPAELRVQAERLLASPRAGITVSDFSEQWLGLSALASAVRRVGFETQMDGSETPVIDSRHSAAWQQSMKFFLADLFVGGGKFTDLFASPRVFVNRELSQLYPNSQAFTGDDQAFVGMDFPAEERTGILTQPALMALLSHSDQSAPILRGVFVRDMLLCDPPPAPPPTVNPTPPALDPTATTRERFAQHTADSSCANCHRLFDPIGLGLENYDELGRYRADENGLPLDVSGEIVLARDSSLDGAFTGAKQLSERLATSAQAQACFITQWYRYGMGRVEQEVDLCSIRQTYDRFVESGGELRAVLLGLVLSDAFRYRSVPPPQASGEEMQP